MLKDPLPLFTRFLVNNGLRTKHGILNIAIKAVDRAPPILTRNWGLKQTKGSVTPITSRNLQAVDQDTVTKNITYVLVEYPQYGQIYNRGLPLKENHFTQSDIDNKDVAYKHGGQDAQIDRFTFVVTDNTNQGFVFEGKVQSEPVPFIIQVDPLDNTVPRIIHLHCITKVELLRNGQYGVYITSRDLKATDEDTSDNNIIFKILSGPHSSYLENVTTGSFVREQFTQKDLNSKSILYMINPSLDIYHDSLEFEVIDAAGNRAAPEILEIKWSRIELLQAMYEVCESEAVVGLKITRKGYPVDSAFISLKVNEVTAVDGKDFSTSPSRLLQFDPGVSTKTWNIAITQDGLEEDDEIFEVVLNSPVNAVLGTKTKAIVKIEDPRGGSCKSKMSRAVSMNCTILPSRKPCSTTTESSVLPYPKDTAVLKGDTTEEFRPSDHPQRRLRLTVNKKSIHPSVVSKEGSDVVYQYHGIMSLRVEEDNPSINRTKTAKVHVTNHGQKKSSLSRDMEIPQSDRAIFTPDITTDHQDKGMKFPKKCTPELKGLLHFDNKEQKLFQCDGISWKAWVTTPKTTKCPFEWIQYDNRCYILIKEKVSWITASRACREQHLGTLVDVFNKEQMDWLWNFSSRKTFWIGLIDNVNTGKWEWTKGEKVTFTNWKRGSPKSSRKGKNNCVVAKNRGKWQTKDCRKGKGYYICSKN